MRARIGRLALTLLLVACAGTAPAQPDKTPPYWASLDKDEAMMRVGPGRTFPASWLYRRKDLPVKVVEVHTEWRKVEDPDGILGWMHVRLLHDDPTAIVKGARGEMRDSPSGDSRLIHRLAPGVIGHISGCAAGWCAFEAGGKRGYVLSRSLWGAIDEQ